MDRARYEVLDGTEPYYGEVPECQGVWATGPTPEQCQAELQSALEDWILFRLSRQLPLPIIQGLDLTVRGVA